MIAKVNRRDPKAKDYGREQPEKAAGVPLGVQPHHEGDRYVQAGKDIPPDTGKIYEILSALDEFVGLVERNGLDRKSVV